MFSKTACSTRRTPPARTLPWQRRHCVARKVTCAASELGYFNKRMDDITKHFPSAFSAEDFLARVEVALAAHGMRGDNSIPVVNLCRDESTGLFKSQVTNALGQPFNINGLGAGISCGCLGFKAGFSHSPIDGGKERYIFMSFPHIGIDSNGKLGSIHRPGRAGASSACGALIAILSLFKSDASKMEAYTDTTHDPLDPELSMLINLLAKRIKAEGPDVASMDLVDITALADRAIHEQLEAMINETVDTSKADYAVISGVHIHNWANEGTGEPTLEWIAPTSSYVVVDGKKVALNLAAIPSLTPRQMAVLSGAKAPEISAALIDDTTIVESRFTDPAAAAC